MSRRIAVIRGRKEEEKKQGSLIKVAVELPQAEFDRKRASARHAPAQTCGSRRETEAGSVDATFGSLSRGFTSPI